MKPNSSIQGELEQQGLFCTLPQMLCRNAGLYPYKVAMGQKKFGIWRNYSWEDYYNTVKDFSLGLISFGLKSGDRVGIVGDLSPEWFWSELAI